MKFNVLFLLASLHFYMGCCQQGMICVSTHTLLVGLVSVTHYVKCTSSALFVNKIQSPQDFTQ
jgi:hypothetical protein